MKLRAACVLVGFLLLVMSQGQLASAQMPSQTASALPRLVRFGGVVKDVNGNPMSGVVGITFALYSEPTGGAALWVETQNVTADSNGHYAVLLGSTKPDGLPSELFTSEQARWVGVQVSWQPEQARLLLVSAPYALKAGDAETVGGLPPSAFVLANAAGSKTEGAASGSATAKAGQSVPPPANSNVTGKGAIGFVPTWDTTSDIVDSVIFQKTSEIGIGTTTPATTLDVNGKSDIRDTLTLFPRGTDSTLAINGTAFKVDQTGKVTFIAGQTFPGAGTITGITTAAGSGLSGGGTTGILSLKVPAAGISNAMLQKSTITLNANTAGGLTTPGAMTLGNIYAMGLKPCATNQILQYSGTVWNCSAAGTGTITKVTAGADLTGGGSAGTVTLNLDTTKVPLLGKANIFTGTQTVNGNLSATGVVTGSGFQIEGTTSGLLFAFGSATNRNAFLGFAGNTTTTGTDNLGIGSFALFRNAAGSGNVAIGNSALNSSAGNLNTAVGLGALLGLGSGSSNTEVGGRHEDTGFNGSNNTFVGASAGAGGNITLNGTTAVGVSAIVGTSNGNVTNATAIGANAQVTANNAMVLGSISGVNGATASVNVGIGTTVPRATLDVAGFELETFIGNPGCGANPFAGIGFGSAGFQSCGNYSMVGDGVNTYVAAPTGNIYFRTQNNALTAMTIDPSGDVNISGNLSKGGGSFKIDHPLDPANKYLYHSFVESPDMMDVYNGNITTDKRGLATVVLPDYFEALNRDFRYQLTVIGQFAQAIIATEVQRGHFTIKTNRPGVKVSWQVTGIRQDAYANAHRIPTEVEKSPEEQGHYLHPELFGARPEQAVNYHAAPPGYASAQTVKVPMLKDSPVSPK